MDNARDRAIEALRYAHGQQGMLGSPLARRQDLSDLEVAQIEAEQRKWTIRSNRQQALGHTLALGRRYDNAADAIDDAKTIANWLGLEIE